MSRPTRIEWWLVRRFGRLVPLAIRRRCGRYWWSTADITQAKAQAAKMAEALGWDHEL